MFHYTKTVQQILTEFRTTENGLASSEAKGRLERHGPNVIRVSGEPLWRKLIEPFANVFMLVLLVAAAISFFHRAVIDAVIILAIMAISALIYYAQRFSTERVLRSLQQRSDQSVHVWRDSSLTRLDVANLVPGDVIHLSEGEKIPADGRLIAARGLRVDEAQLTGESEPITKQTEALTGNLEVYERRNMVFQGSFVVSGEAAAVVTATGNDTEFGQLAGLTGRTTIKSPVQHKIDRLLTQIIAVITAVAVVVFGLSLARGMSITDSLQFVVAMSVSAVPESLPVAISVVLVLGMRRMAAKKALVRNMNAIETVGVITTIATDKTGTLTRNQLSVRDTWRPADATGSLAHLVRRSINQASDTFHDPLDNALDSYATNHGANALKHAPLVSLPFDPAAAMSGNLWHHGRDYELIVKGAPEHILDRSDLTENEREHMNVALHTLTSEGYRVIAIAHRATNRAINSFDQLTRRDRLQFAGFVAVADTLRPEAKKAIAAATRAGVSVRMITGDHFETAYHIGRQLGIVDSRDEVFDSRRMGPMSDAQLEKVIEKTRVFSRVIPEHKYRILTLLKKHHITAMTGDGVNDVPALTAAHVGVAMGSGAEIAKDAGDIILVDDNFKNIVDAMSAGRTIFANIRRMMFYLLATNLGEVLTMIGALVIGLPVPLAPVQILWVNLVTDTAMVIPLGLEPGERTVMNQPPKRPGAPILSGFIISRMLLVAITMAGLSLGMYAYFYSHYGHQYGRTIAFSALVVMQWANAFCARSDSESFLRRLRVVNGKFYAGLTCAVAVQLFVLFGPLGPALHVAPVTLSDLFITGVIAFVVPIIVSDAHKYIGRRFAMGRSTPTASSQLARPDSSMVY